MLNDYYIFKYLLLKLMKTMASFGERAISTIASFYPCFTSNER